LWIEKCLFAAWSSAKSIERNPYFLDYYKNSKNAREKTGDSFLLDGDPIL